MDVREFDFDLPPELIAQEPAGRGADRLLVLDRPSGTVAHHLITDLPSLLRADDLLVVNNSRVFPARLIGTRCPGGGAVECLLVRPVADHEVAEAGGAITGPGERWEALVHPGQRLRPGSLMVFDDSSGLRGQVLVRLFHGRRIVRLWTTDGSPVEAAVDRIGHVPLPPYIKRPDHEGDRDRYQTVFAQARGSIAAPTAGLHFTPDLLVALRRRGVTLAELTLHIGYGTFQPVRVDRVENHRLEPERFEMSVAGAAAVNQALDEKRRVVAVGTTTTRVLEAGARAHDGRLVAGSGTTDLFIYPGFPFRVLGGLLTNFHLPRSSLFMLVCAFAGRESVLAAYHEAIAARYRFYSYGDAMLILSS